LAEFVLGERSVSRRQQSNPGDWPFACSKRIQKFPREHRLNATAPTGCNCVAVAFGQRRVVSDDFLTISAEAISCAGTTRMAPIRATGASPLTSAAAFRAWLSLAMRAESGARRIV